jgi:hypothetical protein
MSLSSVARPVLISTSTRQGDCRGLVWIHAIEYRVALWRFYLPPGAYRRSVTEKVENEGVSNASGGISYLKGIGR